MAAIFPDVHRDLKSITVNGDEASLELAIQGTFEGPLPTPAGTLRPNGAKIDVPTADFWYLQHGKIRKFAERGCPATGRAAPSAPADMRPTGNGHRRVSFGHPGLARTGPKSTATCGNR